MTGASPAQRLEAVRDAIGRSARLAGRRAADVTLIAVSKTHGAESIRPLIAAGQREFGENRVQEAQDKWPALRAEASDLRLHLIGRLQSNKAGDAVALFDSIHSVDRPSLIEALAEAMARQGRRPDCFLQVVSGNVSLYNETNGQGILPTPAIGGVGLVDDVTVNASIAFKDEGEVVILIGETQGWLGQSIYLRDVCGREEGAPPPVDLVQEKRNGEFVRPATSRPSARSKTA